MSKPTKAKQPELKIYIDFTSWDGNCFLTTDLKKLHHPNEVEIISVNTKILIEASLKSVRIQIGEVPYYIDMHCLREEKYIVEETLFILEEYFNITYDKEKREFSYINPPTNE